MAIPRFSVIEFTTPSLSFAEDVAAYRDAGADGIGIVEGKLRPEESLSYRADLRLPGPDDPARRIDELCASLRRLARFEPDCCFVVSGPLGRYGEREARAIVVDGVRRLARLAAESGITVTVEVMAPSLREEFTFISSIPQLAELLHEVGEPNTAMAIDVWHLSERPEPLADLREHASRIASVHVSDRRAPTRTWCDRLLPGDGVADLAGIHRSLEAGGFDGWFELEVISDDGSVEVEYPDSLWKRDPRELVAAGRAQFISTWEARLADGR